MYSLALEGALVPAGVLTDTFTVPAACVGACTVSSDGDTKGGATFVEAPNFTGAPGPKSRPVIVTVFPPAVGPPVGLTPVTTGAPNAYRSLLVAALVAGPVV